MNRNDAVTLDDILDEIMLQEQEPNHQALTRWCKQYPEHTEELTRFFATWAVQEMQTERPEIDEERVANRMVSHALNLLHSQSAADEAEVKTVGDTRLHKMVRARGLSDDTLVNECGLDRSLLAKLDRHLIVFNGIPRTCIDRLARVLECAAETIITSIRGEPIPLNSYKSKGKPTLRQEEFLDAVATSDLPDNSKEEWKRIAAGETSS